MRVLGVLLAMITMAGAGSDEADAQAAAALRIYYGTLGDPGASIDSVRSQLVPIMKDLSPRVGKSVRNVIRRGFDKKYKKDLNYKRGLCDILAAGGKTGLNLLFKEYKSSMRDDDLREQMAEAFAQCGDEDALESLLKMVYDKAPKVAAAAVTGCASHAKVQEKERKEAVKQLVTYYGKVTDGAAGKDAESREMELYLALKPAMNGTLKAFTGQDLDSAAAFKAWLDENITQTWDG